MGATLPDIAFVTEDFFHGKPWAHNANYNSSACHDPFGTSTNQILRTVDLECFNDDLVWLQNLTATGAVQNEKLFKKLDNAECISTYGQPLTSDVDTLFVVVDSQNTSENNTVYGISVANWFGEYMGIFAMLEANSSSQSANGTLEPSTAMTIMGYETSEWTGDPYMSWICGNGPGAHYAQGNCNIKHKSNDAATWEIGGHRISYCLSKVFPEQKCKLQLSSYILIIVTVANAVKAICMLLAFFRAKTEPLVTLGDAIQSFLNDPDPRTKDRCLWVKKDFKRFWRVNSGLHFKHDENAKDRVPFNTLANSSPVRWQPSKKWWFQAIGGGRYWTFIIL
jgi:hypothetical protein